MFAGDKREAIAYAQPLILPDGTVYGVVGVELLCSYLEEQLPLTELQNDGTGAYLLAVMTDEKRIGSIPLQPVTFSTQDRSLKKRAEHCHAGQQCCRHHCRQ